MDWILATLGLAGMTGTWLHYLWLIPQERVPEQPTGHRGAFGLAALLSVAAVATASGLAVGVSALVAAVTLGGWAFFEWLMGWAPLPDGELAVVLGEPMPDVGGLDAEGRFRPLADWRGQRVLFKVFRGHW